MSRDDGGTSAELDRLLNAIEDTCDPPQYIGFREAFMLDCAALIEQRMSASAARALQIANGHRAGMVSLHAVSDTHDECWESLRINHREMQFDNPEVASIRAVICILHGQLHPGSDEFVDALSFFLRLLNTVEPHSTEQEQLIRKHFADCLTQ
jgi:hypothetical protein